MARATKISAHFDDGTAWPLPHIKDLEWRLRYAGDYGPPIEKSELLTAAWIVSSFRTIVLEMTQKERNDVCRRLEKIHGDIYSQPLPYEAGES